MMDFALCESKRLYLRDFNSDDAEAVFSYAGNAENTYFMEWGPDSREDVDNFMAQKFTEQIESPRRRFDLAVCLRENGKLIGSAGLFLDESRSQAELGYIFHRDYQHMGYASEAAEALLRFGFMNLDLHRIYARCDGENFASEAVMKRIGMRKEADMKSCKYTKVGQKQQWRGEKLYALLQKEYLNRAFDAIRQSENRQ